MINKSTNVINKMNKYLSPQIIKKKKRPLPMDIQVLALSTKSGRVKPPLIFYLFILMYVIYLLNWQILRIHSKKKFKLTIKLFKNLVLTIIKKYFIKLRKCLPLDKPSVCTVCCQWRQGRSPHDESLSSSLRPVKLCLN